VMGTCKLCLADGVVLRQSHFLPQGIYKAVRVTSGSRNPNPVVISPTEVKQTSHQTKAHLLCSKCELLFGGKGEDWVMRHGLKNNGSFMLLRNLRRYQRMIDASGNAAIFKAAEIPEINVAALTYFATSMFWRGSIHPWKTDGTRPVPLGPYEEPLREFLLGEADFPEDMTLSVVVRLPSPVSYFTYEPIGEWRDSSHFVAKFPMPGFAFGISAGPALPQIFHDLCFVRGNGNPIALTALLEEGIQQDGVDMLQRVPEQKRQGFDTILNAN
jgi:hypothetical protein